MESVQNQIKSPSTPLPSSRKILKQFNLIVFFARLKTDKTRAVIGEKIQCSLRFYCSDNNVSLQGLEEPETVHFTFADKKAPLAGTEYIKGKRYSYVEWTWNAQPKKDGSLVIPAYGIDFLAPSDEEDDFLSPFSFFSRKRLERQRLYSNTVSVAIDPLPAFNGTVHAMGNFKYLAARMNPSHAKVGEGLVFSVELEGEGDINEVEMPELSNMPDCFKWYDSKSTVMPSNQKDGYSRKTFEYIVQGLKPGEWEIPKQKFTFFNPKTRSYKTLESEPLLITIKPAAQSAQTYSAPASAALATTVDTHVEIEDLLAPLDNKHSYSASVEWKIPWILFLIVFLLPVAVWFFSNKNFFKSTVRGKIAAVVQARKALHNARQRRACNEIYGIFVHFFATVANSDPKLMSQESIDRILRDKLPADQMRRWDSFFSTISEFAFFNKDTHKLNNDVWNESEYWLSLFEKML